MGQARLHHLALGLSDQAFGAGKVDLQAHMGIAQHLAQPGQGGGIAGCAVELGKCQRRKVCRPVRSVRSGQIDQVASGRHPRLCRCQKVQNCPCTIAIGDHQMRGTRPWGQHPIGRA